MRPLGLIVGFMVDFFGIKAKAELDAFRATSEKLDEARREEIQRMGALLQSTVMKLLALTNKDAFRTVSLSEAPKVEQKPIAPAPFMRRSNLASAISKSREKANGSEIS